LDRCARSDVVVVNFDNRRSTSVVEHIPHDPFELVVGIVDNGRWFVDNFNLFISGDEEEGGNLVRIRLDVFEVRLVGPVDPVGIDGGRGFGG
jgi:hypothetical protein